MAKPLRDIASKTPKESKLSGVKKSTTEPEDISDFNASSGNQDFAKKHKVEKHSDRVGNDKVPYTSDNQKYALDSKNEKRLGNKKGEAEKVYEAMKCESCGKSYEGESCGCGGKSVPEAKPGKRGMIADKKKLQEVLTKKTPASEVISDFVHSKNKTFSGDSKKQRIKRALGAYYGMRKEESEQIDEISDALALSTAKGALKSINSADVNTDKGFATIQKRTKTQALALDKMNPDYKRLKAKVGTSEANAKDAAYKDAVKEENINEIAKKKKTQKESAPGDTPIRMPSGNVGDSDTGRI